MPDNRNNLRDTQRQDQAQIGVKATVRESPAATPTGLLYLSGTNCRKPIESILQEIEEKEKEFFEEQLGGDKKKLTSHQTRQIEGIRRNFRHWVEVYGIERLVFHTVTCKDNCTDKKEFEARYKRYRNHWEEAGLGKVLVRIVEKQRRGAFHLHSVMVVDYDARSGFDFEAYKHAKQLNRVCYDFHGGVGEAPESLQKLYYDADRKFSKSANPRLRECWKKIGVAALKSGFGICETIPIKNEKHCSNYVAKYLGKSLELQNDEKYLRKLSYGRNIPRAIKGEWRHVNGASREWRLNLGSFCRYKSIEENDFEALRDLYGVHWSAPQGKGAWISMIGERERALEDAKIKGKNERRRFRMQWIRSSKGTEKRTLSDSKSTPALGAGSLSFQPSADQELSAKTHSNPAMVFRE